jgi:DNA-binding transcriptional LysR family regulator
MICDHQHLRYFIAVAEELNFSRAAERLHMAQPPLSAAIRRLEQAVGTELLARTTRQVVLTAAGEEFLRGSYRTLEELEHTIRATRRAASCEAPSLRLGFGCATKFETVAALCHRFRAIAPDVTLDVQEMWSSRIPPALRDGSIDAGVCLAPEATSGIASEVIRKERIAAIVPCSHVLAKEKEVPIAEFAQDTFLLAPRDVGPRLHDSLLGLCRRAGFEPRVRYGGVENRWELEVLAESKLVSLGPLSIRRVLPPNLQAVPVTERDELETAIVSRVHGAPPAVHALRQAAADLFGRRD